MKLLSTTLIIFLFTSCGGDKVDRSKLPGRYVFTHWNHDTIDVRHDGTYHHYTHVSGKKLENNGTWKVNSMGNEIQFNDFSFQSDGNPKGNWFSRLRVDGKEVHLMYADDINAYYNKISELDSAE